MAIDLIKYVPHLNVELLAACICTMSCIYTSIYTRKGGKRRSSTQHGCPYGGYAMQLCGIQKHADPDDTSFNGHL